MLDYRANQLARNKNMQRLRDLRLAREAVAEPVKGASNAALPRRKMSS